MSESNNGHKMPNSFFALFTLNYLLRSQGTTQIVVCVFSLVAYILFLFGKEDYLLVPSSVITLLFLLWLYASIIYDRYVAQQAIKRVQSPSIKKLDVSIREITSLLERSNFNNRPHIKSFLTYNLNLYVIIKDILVLRKLLTRAKNKEAKNVLARATAVQLYELYSNLSDLYNKDFELKYIRPLGNDELFNVLINLKRLIKIMKDDHLQMLKTIRHNTFGHRDLNSIHQLIIIQSVDIKKIIQITYMATLIHYLLKKFMVKYLAMAEGGLIAAAFSKTIKIEEPGPDLIDIYLKQLESQKFSETLDNGMPKTF